MRKDPLAKHRSITTYRPSAARIAGLLALASVLLAANVDAQASVSTRIENANGGLCSIPSTNGPSGTPTSLAWIQSASNPGCDLFASAFAYLGVAGARVRAEHHSENGPSASFQGNADASWRDSAIPTFGSRFVGDVNVDRLRVRYSIGATGSVSAASNGLARLGYQFNIAGQAFSGDQQRNGVDGEFITHGTFGTISGTVELASLGIVNGFLAFNPFSLFLSGQAYAGAGRGFGGPASGVADADFGSTLIWNGISSVEALDAAGNVIAVPDGAFAGFISQQTGFDYRNAAVHQTTVTPEPSTLLLTGIALTVIILLRRRRLTLVA